MRINFIVGGEIMVQAILEIFTSEEKATAMLANPIIEFIFMVLMITFVITLFVHVALFVRLRKTRNYLKETNRMDIEPLQSIQKQFDKLEHREGTYVETFVQERFSSWRVFHIPVINLIKLIQMRSEERRVGKEGKYTSWPRDWSSDVCSSDLFVRLRKTRNYLKETNRMDIEPLQSIQKQFDKLEHREGTYVETFVQERFSSWRVFHIPVINLIKLIQMTVSIFILLGVLGTFIGLTISLGSINAGGDQLVENVANVLSGIDVAFYTSIFGMGFSLIMTILVKMLNTEYMLTDLMLMVESNLVRDEQEGMSRLIAVSETMNESIL